MTWSSESSLVKNVAFDFMKELGERDTMFLTSVPSLHSERSGSDNS